MFVSEQIKNPFLSNLSVDSQKSKLGHLHIYFAVLHTLERSVMEKWSRKLTCNIHGENTVASDDRMYNNPLHTTLASSQTDSRQKDISRSQLHMES